MPFKPKPKQPEFASLKTMLAQTKAESPLYQTIQLLIERLMQMQGVTLQDIADINASINDVNTAISVIEGILKLRTFITLEDETLYLPNSYQVLPGTNITFDTTIPNELTINSTGGGDHVAMSTGAEPLEVMSNGAGQILYVGFTPP